MNHDTDHETILFRRNLDHVCSGPASLQFEIEVARIVAEDSIPLHNEIRRLRDEARRWYRADGSFETLDSPEEVIRRRIEAAKALSS